jgi:starch synthase
MELARLGHDTRLVLPRYVVPDGKADSYDGFADWGTLAVPVGSGGLVVNVEEGRLKSRSSEVAVPVFGIRHDPFFARTGLYGERGTDYPDNLDRFSLFCRAVLELARSLAETGWIPDLLHAHDWQTALCPVYRRAFYGAHAGLGKLRTLLTIHNLGFQGIFQSTEYWKTGLSWDLFTPAGLEYYGSLNVLKGGLLFADFLTTVSPTYAREIQASQQGFGLEGVLQERQDRLVGVVNGIDTDIWNPATDPYLAAPYSVSDLSGKKACKTALQRELALPVRSVPLIGMVSRLTNQKGLDLVASVFPDLMALDLQIILLGTGDPASEAQFRSFQQRYADKVAVRIGFDEALAHRIEAGADLFLMPSRYEPCGLSQLYSLRYGTVPLVRRTGGLIDTVVPYGPQTIRDKQATGFAFDEPTPQALLNAILLALRVYGDAAEWSALVEAGMRTDVSGRKTAEAYAKIYERMMRG